MKNKQWRKSEVLAYIEELILRDEANDDEIRLYEDWVWNSNINELNTYNKVLKKMKRQYEGK